MSFVQILDPQSGARISVTPNAISPFWHGVWEAQEDSSPVLEIRVECGEAVMRLFDRTGNEYALISAVKFAKTAISFQSRFQSSLVSHKHKITLVTKNRMHHQLTFVFHSRRLPSAKSKATKRKAEAS